MTDREFLLWLHGVLSVKTNISRSLLRAAVDKQLAEGAPPVPPPFVPGHTAPGSR